MTELLLLTTQQTKLNTSNLDSVEALAASDSLVAIDIQLRGKGLRIEAVGGHAIADVNRPSSCLLHAQQSLPDGIASLNPLSEALASLSRFAIASR